jgi:hypothetical protein
MSDPVPHECDTPFPYPERIGAQWTCPECGLIWELTVGIPMWETIGQVEPA